MIRYEIIDGVKVETQKYKEWKAAHENYEARVYGHKDKASHDKAKAEAKKQNSVIAMLKRLGASVAAKGKSGGKQSTKKSSGAAVKHIRQKV